MYGTFFRSRQLGRARCQLQPFQLLAQASPDGRPRTRGTRRRARRALRRERDGLGARRVNLQAKMVHDPLFLLERHLEADALAVALHLGGDLGRELLKALLGPDRVQDAARAFFLVHLEAFGEDGREGLCV